MVTLYERYLTGEYEQAWDELCLLGPEVRKAPYFDDALAVARETMQRVRRNCQILIPRLEQLRWRFGYEWATERAASSERYRAKIDENIAREPPLLGEPTPTDVLDNIESNNGLLPISLRVFYEVVGAINFVGTPFERPDWPGIEDALDPLYIAGVAQTFGHQHYEWDEQERKSRLVGTGDALVTRWWPNRVEVAPDFLHKYYFSGVGSEYVELPTAGADAPLMFEGGPLQVEGRDLTFVRYLRYAMRGGGFLAFLPGSMWKSRPEDDLAYLTEGLLPI